MISDRAFGTGHTTGQAEPTLRDLVIDLKTAWLFVLSGMVAGGIAAVAFMHLAVPHYKAEMIIGPTAETSSADLTALLGQFDLPNLQYIVRRPGTSESAEFTRLEAVFTAPSVASLLAGRKDLQDGIAQDRDFSFSSSPDTGSAVRLSEYISGKVKIQPVGSTYLRRVRYSHPDPEFAVLLLDTLRQAADEMIRSEVREQTEKRIAYVSGQLESVKHPQHRQALLSILMEQEHLRMMVNMEEPFAASVAEPPSSTSRPFWPKRSLFYPVFAFAGALAGYLIYSLRRLA